MKMNCPLIWHKPILLCALLAVALSVSAQESRALRENIATLQVVAGDNWTSMPVVELGGKPIHISFDELSHDYKRYVYRLEHCEADWTASTSLFSSDFVQGFNGTQTITDVEQSINTNHLYTHYHLSLPNEDCRIMLSGNYRLYVYDADEGEEQPVLEACFMVVEPQMSVSLAVSTNTDVDVNRSHQQVTLGIGYGNLRVTNPTSQLKTAILQNGQWRTAVRNEQPSITSANGLEWTHSRALVFDAGNEYRKFETLATDHASMGVENLVWDGNEYHAYVYVDEPCNSYLTDESANGSFYIRNSDNVENDITTDYLWVHFRLQTDCKPTDTVYLDGDWARSLYDASPLRMKYNAESGLYETSVLLKQGYYSYHYLLRDSSGRFSLLPSEGSFFQTENQYQALVYYRGQNDRTDRLVGYREVRIK